MKGKIVRQRRVTSGMIKDPELHEQRIEDIVQKRQAMWAITIILATGVAFVAVAIFMKLSS